MFPGAALADKRVALVVGNSGYEAVAPLANPERDAGAVADRLAEMGFEVISGIDLDRRGFEQKLRAFSRAVDGADIGLFYYAGHGLQVDGSNYLVPTDAQFRDASALDFEAIDVDLVNRQMEGKVDVSLMILDACRDNPLTRTLTQAMGPSASRSLGVGSGLAEMRSPQTGKGSAVIYATSPGDVAEDGDGRHSPFTGALLRHMDEPGLNIQSMMSRVTQDVYEGTNGRQRPWMNASLIGEVYIDGPGRTQTARADTVEPQQPAAQTRKLEIQPHDDAPSLAEAGGRMLDEQRLLFEIARESELVDDYEAYLARFPDGVFAEHARRSIARIERAEAEDRIAEATRSDHAQLGLNRSRVREIQARLKAAGQSPGYADGLWGPRTEAALRGWQESVDAPVTGYLSREQLTLLEEQTGESYRAHMPSQTRTSTRSQPSNRTRTRQRSSPSTGEALAIGVMGAIINQMGR